MNFTQLCLKYDRVQENGTFLILLHQIIYLWTKQTASVHFLKNIYNSDQGQRLYRIPFKGLCQSQGL